eukprot:m.370462 g.370462  ORF g.370462 m.370462 type:complete len:337 (-) comp56128_c0_seq7:130-1140(-)
MDKLSSFAAAVARSPGAVRRALASPGTLRRVFGAKEYAALDDTTNQDNGFSRDDKELLVGVSFKVKYLGSVTVSRRAAEDEAAARQETASAARYVEKHPRGKHQTKLFLKISREAVVLSDSATGEVLLSHSISRVGFTTVDKVNRNLFLCVARVKNSRTPLCHVFQCKTVRDSYDLTFTCAHAFHLKYVQWMQQKKEELDAAPASPAGSAAPSGTLSAGSVPVAVADTPNQSISIPVPQLVQVTPVAGSPKPSPSIAADAAPVDTNPFHDGYVEIVSEADDNEAFLTRALTTEKPHLIRTGVDKQEAAEGRSLSQVAADWKSEEDLSASASVEGDE